MSSESPNDFSELLLEAFVVPGVPATKPVGTVTFGTTGNLFPGQQLSPSNSRFIHMNPWTQQQSNKSPLHGVSVRQELGCDTATGPSATSCPLFMYCDSTRTTKANGGDSDSNLYYGTMMRLAADGSAPTLAEPIHRIYDG